MANNVPITPGAGVNITTLQATDGSEQQVVKLAVAAATDQTPIPATAANGLTVDVTRVAGVVHVDDNSGLISIDDGGGTLTVDDGGASLTVDAPVATPVFVRLSDGTNPIATLPVSGTVTVSGAVTTSGTVAATQSGTWNVGTVTTITNVVHIDDNSGLISIDDGGGSLTVDGTVTVTQGTAAANAGAWPILVSDGTDTVGISAVAGAKALKVDVVRTALTEGVYKDGDGLVASASSDPSQKFYLLGATYSPFSTALATANVGILRCSAKRSLNVHLYRESDGAEIGISGSPIRTDPTNTTPTTVQDGGASLTVDAPVGTPVFVRLSDGTNPIATLPVSGAVTVTGPVSQSGAWTSDLIKINGSAIVSAAAGIQKVGIVDGVGNVWSSTNPLPVSVDNLAHTRVTNSNTVGASETGTAVWTPTGSTKFCIRMLIVACSVGGVMTIYDGTNSAANLVFKGTLPIGVTVLPFVQPFVSAAVNNVLRYTTGTGIVAELQVHGFESA